MPTAQSSTDDKLLETLGGRIKAVRTARGLKLGAVAAHIKLSRTSLSQWEANAVRNPDVEKLGAFVELTNVNLDWLIKREGEDPDLAPAQTRRRRASNRAAAMTSGDTGALPAESPIPEVAPLLSVHAAEINLTPRALWVIPHQVLEIGFNTVADRTVIKRIVTRSSPEFGLSRGDYILIDTSRQRIDEPGIYIVADVEGRSACRVLIVEKGDNLEIAVFSDDLQRSYPQATVDNLIPLGRVMGVFKPA